ncbi:hypothetical protein DIPPA_16080 [Diplonema papillatum]|nr:hypothetical protein DIPPA_16080 [Diplonema papillatum]
MEQCREQFEKLHLSDEHVQGMCSRLGSGSGAAEVVDRRLKCWRMASSAGVKGVSLSPAEKVVLCGDSCEGDVKERVSCWERVMWRGKTDAKYSIAPDDAAVLCSRVASRADSSNVQSCWKKCAFDSHRDSSLAVPPKKAVEICSAPSVEEQQLRMDQFHSQG